jgi:hypothetical protein
MIYGTTDTGERVLPQKNIQAYCPHCKDILIAKCGRIKVHHWAHKEAKDCPYSYGMTYWHYKWLLDFDGLKSEGWEIEYFYDSTRFDAFNPSKRQAVEFQRIVDLDYMEHKIQICDKAGIKLFWLISPQVFQSFVHTYQFNDKLGDIIFSLRHCSRKIMLLLEEYINHPLTLFLTDFRQEDLLPNYSTDSVDIHCSCYSDFRYTGKEKHPMKKGIYIIQDLPYVNDRYYRKDSVITLKYHKNRFMRTGFSG